MAWSEWTSAFDRELTSIRYEKRYRERGGGVARIVLACPERLNTYDVAMGREIIAAFQDANKDNTIGVVLFTHEGPHWGVGGNVQGLTDDANSEQMIIGQITPDVLIQRCFKPVIAVVRGYSVGMHNHMAYHCDFTLAGESAVFGQSGPKVGSPISGSLVAISATVLGMKRARQMWMLTQQFTAQEALDWGLVNAVVQDRLLDEEAELWCDQLLDRVPTSIAAIKQTFEAMNAPLAGTNNVLTLIEPDFGGRPEPAEAGTAFFEKRPPNFWTDEMTKDRF